MMTKGETSNRRVIREVAVIGTAWTAGTALFLLGWGEDPYGRTTLPFQLTAMGWYLSVLAAAVLVTVMAIMVAIGAYRTWRGSSSTPGRIHQYGLIMCVCAWFFGGLFALAALWAADAVCSGNTYGTFACAYRSGRVPTLIGVTSAILATPALFFRLRVADRSRLNAWLSPLLILGLYLLAFRLWQPHANFGETVPQWLGTGAVRGD